MKADDWVPANTTHDWAADPRDVAHISDIRAAPDRFVGSLDGDGVVHLLLEVLAYVRDEAIAGGATRARVDCLGDRFVVSDDGRGTQMVRDPDTGSLLVKPIMASADLRYFGRDDAPLLASGTKRSGISVVNALSSTLTHSSLREGSIAWVQRYERGVPVGSPEVLDDHPRGTRVQFRPDEIFGNVSYADVAERLRRRCANFAPLVVAVT